MKNKKTLSEEEKLKLCEFFEKSLMTWPEYSVNLIDSCRHCEVWFIKDLMVKIVYEKNLFSQATSKGSQDWELILFAQESCNEIREIFCRHNICLDIFLEPSPEILCLFFEKYPQYKKPPL